MSAEKFVNSLPAVRPDLLVQDLPDEVLVYDKTTNKSYCLNSTARTVFDACNGKTTLESLRQKLPEEIIYLALDELQKRELLLTDYASPFAGINRREVIRRVGLASMAALPVVASLVAPTAASAASTACTCSAPANSNARLEGCPCVSNNDCCGVCLLLNGGMCSEPQPLSVPTAARCCPMP